MGSIDAAGDTPVLLGPARQRLVEAAAELLGRLSADEVPPALRAVARFTPAKRARLGATALASVLDADDAFRARIGELVADGLPSLVDALRTGGSTQASDPLDVAVVAYLLRPDGWRAIVRDATERHLAEHAPQAAADAEVARLREETAALRARVKELEAERRSADAAVRELAEERTRTDTEQLRRRLRAQGAELRQARLERDGAVAARTEAEAALADAEERARATAEQARSLAARPDGGSDRSGGPRPSGRAADRAARDLDAARLWLLVDTVTEAAAGIRRELSLPPPPGVRPADTVAAGQGADAARELPDTGALDGVLRLPHVHLVVDGYNVTKTGYGDLPLEDQRRRLVTALAALAGRAASGTGGPEITVAFDGAVRPPSLPPTPRGVRVLFSAQDEIADDLIRRLVAAEPGGRPVCVVTSDRAVVNDVRAHGAWTAASPVLLALLSR